MKFIFATRGVCTQQRYSRVNGVDAIFENPARHPRVHTLLASGHPTALRSFTLMGDESDKQRSSVAHGILSANVVTQFKAKPFVVTPRDVASPLAQ